MAQGADGQGVAADFKLNILLFKAGEIRFQQVVVTFVGDIGFEFGEILRPEEGGKGAVKENSRRCVAP